MPRNESWPPSEPAENASPSGVSPEDSAAQGARFPHLRRKLLIFAPLLLVVAVVLLALRFPWQFVAIAAAIFAVWLLIEG